MPMVESSYARILEESGQEAAAEMLNGYARDFFGATILRWDELENMFWRELWQGF